jgi:hypothetical protein
LSTSSTSSKKLAAIQRSGVECCERKVAVGRLKGNYTVTDNQKPSAQDLPEAVSRRAIAKKIAYVAPVAFAVIAASERPALAQSSSTPPLN